MDATVDKNPIMGSAKMVRDEQSVTASAWNAAARAGDRRDAT